ETHDDAMNILRGFGASIRVGPEAAASIAHQVALLTLVNLARRTLLGGVEVLGLPDAPLLVPLARAHTLADAVIELGGTLVPGNQLWPAVQIGTVPPDTNNTAWSLTWQRWRGGVIPRHDARRLADDEANPLAAAVAAASAAAELFAWHSEDSP